MKWEKERTVRVRVLGVEDLEGVGRVRQAEERESELRAHKESQHLHSEH